MSDIVDNLNDIIGSGIKIHSANQEIQQVRIINGLEKQNEKAEVYISAHNIPFDEELKEFIQSEKFQNALFRPVRRGILLIDIAGFSKGDTLHQAAVLSVFNQVIKYSLDALKSFSDRPVVEQIIPTGDGCYIVFNEDINSTFFRAVLTINSAMHAVQGKIAERFEKNGKEYDKLRVRIGCTLQETDFFYDVTGQRNCYGVGMNEAARILSYGQKEAELRFQNTDTIGSLFFDETLMEQAKPILDTLKKIQRNMIFEKMCDVADKHGITRTIYWLNNLPRNLSFFLAGNQDNRCR